MKEKIKLAIGIIILFSVSIGFSIYNDYVINHSPKAGVIIENNIEPVDFNEYLMQHKNK